MLSRASLRSPAVAAFLSFVFPGLGLIGAGNRRRGLIVALPALVLTVLSIAMLVADRHAIGEALFSETAVTSFLVVDVLLLLYRLWAIADTYIVVSAIGRAASGAPSGAPGFASGGDAPRLPRNARRAGAVVLAVVFVLTTATHVVVGAVGLEYRDQLLGCVFNPDVPCWFGGNGDLAAGETAPPVVSDDTPAVDLATSTPTPTLNATDSGTPAPSSSFTFPPAPTPGKNGSVPIPVYPIENVSGPNTPPSQWQADGYLNVLLVGADQGVGRWSLRPDTMILLEVQISTGKAVMYGIPRNIENVPLPPESANAYPCHCFPYPNLLNGLWRDAVNKPKSYPYAGTDFARGFKALEGAIGQYLGLHVDGAVVVNLMGFVHLIDALGGLDIYVPKELKDSQYSRPQDGKDIKIDIKAGQQHMNGYTALAYARSRHQDSDYGRMGRQQAVLVALRAQLKPCDLVPKIPSLISTLGSAFWTDMPASDAPALAALAEHVGTSNVKSIELVPALTGNPVGFLTIGRVATVRNIVAHGLDGVPAGGGSSSGGGGGGGLSC
jgi:LCP family protein required for cell wall assembly